MSNDHTIRRATVADAEAIASINIDVWRSTYAGIIEQPILDAMEMPRYIRKWQDILSGSAEAERWCYLAVVEDAVVGYVAAARNPDADTFEGIIHALYLRPEYHGYGVGKSLFERALASFSEHGLGSFKLYVLKDNKLGRRFYDRYAPDVRQDATNVIEGNVYCDMLYGWHHIPKNGMRPASE